MRFTCPIAVAAAILACAGGVRAQTAPKTEAYTWKSVKIVAGGFITGIVFSPTEPGLAYCRTDIGGAYRIDNKSKLWFSLTDWVGPTNSNLGGCESVAPDPVNPDKVYLALGTYRGGGAGIARSSDAGKTFQVTTIPVTMGGNEDGRGMGERLAVDPNDTRVLYFGSRRDGLWRSADAAVTWARVEAMPVTGGNGGGITWLIFDTRKDDAPNQPTRSIFAGVAAGGTSSLYHSADAGQTWQPIADSPNFMPHRAVLEPGSHTLYVSFGNGPGPNNVSSGAVAKYDIDANKWTLITPNNPGNGGYGGIALDRQHPATLMVSTIDHWGPADDIFRSTDGGATWKPIAATTDRDTSFSPYMSNLLRGHRFDWWLAALAIDPFDSNHAMYGTGGTIWGTHDMTDFDAGKHTRWTIAADGVEETAVLALASPPWPGPVHLISGVGDIGGFTHLDFDVSPASFHTNPSFNNTTSIEFADLKPVVVRTGGNGGGRAGYSEDGGMTWRPITLPGAPAAAAGGRGRGGGGGGGGFVTLSADGATLLASGGAGISISKDKGATWTPSTGLFNGARPFADRVAPATFYALDTPNAQIYTSTDGGATFTAKPVAGLPQGGGAARGGRGGGGRGGGVKASFAKQGELWLASGGALYHSTDAGANFAISSRNITVNNFALGKAAPGHDNPAIFATGSVGRVAGIYRSDDNGSSWVRVNDDQHQYGGSPSVMTADPRVYGRVYIGMNGRGVLHGEPSVNN
ncbi:MAG: carbohydrate-binding protein [Verrucomicrobiota bacterium]|jgi:photosystem II stability/assembly factor-like uncharacterized protein